VEAQVQLGEQRDGGHQVLGEAQRLEPPAHHGRPDHLVVVERHPAAGLLAAGARLADVVQQRGQPQHQVGPSSSSAMARSSTCRVWS
jgi:hypothetical protein